MKSFSYFIVIGIKVIDTRIWVIDKDLLML